MYLNPPPILQIILYQVVNDSKHAFFMAGSTNKLQAGHNNDWDKVIDQRSNGGASILNIWNLGTVTFDTDSGFDLYIMEILLIQTLQINHSSANITTCKYC